MKSMSKVGGRIKTLESTGVVKLPVISRIDLRNMWLSLGFTPEVCDLALNVGLVKVLTREKEVV